MKNNKKPHEKINNRQKKKIKNTRKITTKTQNKKQNRQKVSKREKNDKSTFEILFGNHGLGVLRAKEERDNPAGYQHTVQQTAAVMVWGCSSVEEEK